MRSVVYATSSIPKCGLWYAKCVLSGIRPFVVYAGSSRGHLPRESLANWLRSSVGRHRHVGHAGGVCGLGRPGAAPSRVDARSWERDFQRRDAKCVTLCISEGASTSLFAFQRHSLHFIRLSRLRFARDLLMMVHPRGTSATSGLKITAELVAIDRGASLSAVSLIGCLLFACERHPRRPSLDRSIGVGMWCGHFVSLD